jgi:hypothetical protein
MDQYILEDNLKPDEVRLVKEMLNAIVSHSDAFHNSFNVERTGLHAHIRGYEYYLSPKSGFSSPFRNKQILPEDISLILFDLNFVETERGHRKSGSWFSFTSDALEWHRQFGGLSADEIRKRIGRVLYREAGWSAPNDYREEDVAQEIGSTPERVKFETIVLMRAGLVRCRFQGTSDFGVLRLTEPDGILWATGGFQPIGDRRSQTVGLTVDLRLEVKTIIEEARAANVNADLLEKYEARLRRVEEELERTDGPGRLQTVHDLVETANGSKDLLIPTVGFLATHADKIKTFVEGVGNLLT